MSLNSDKPIVAIGVMSGTSLDGIDVVRVMTDGGDHCEVEGHFYREYEPALRERIAAVTAQDIGLSDMLRLERDISSAYVRALLASNLLEGAAVVGVHGQTIRHLPKEGLTWQVMDVNYVAEKVGIPVVGDFRRRDMAAGGEGAPLAPLFHAMMLRKAGVAQGAVLNIGGIANVTVVNANGAITASDCGTGMGLLNRWIKKQTGAEFDRDGALSLSGKADMELVKRALAEVDFWKRPLPRSADRHDFDVILEWLDGYSVADGAATLAALSARGICLSLQAMGGAGVVFAAGGGMRNKAILEGMSELDVRHVNELGFDEQAVEAGCWAWLAARRLRGLPTTLPSTTHCAHPTVGGVLTV
jgi:anhydro-N-acetylmuramic acid kinase